MTTESNNQGSSDAEPNTSSAASASVRRESWYVRLKNWLWGHDFFISYHWGSGGTYAVSLAARLREKGYEVFLDRADYAMGDDWQRVGEIALRNTKRLIVIATRETPALLHHVLLLVSFGLPSVPQDLPFSPQKESKCHSRENGNLDPRVQCPCFARTRCDTSIPASALNLSTQRVTYQAPVMSNGIRIHRQYSVLSASVTTRN